MKCAIVRAGLAATIRVMSLAGPRRSSSRIRGEDEELVAMGALPVHPPQRGIAANREAPLAFSKVFMTPIFAGRCCRIVILGPADLTAVLTISEYPEMVQRRSSSRRLLRRPSKVIVQTGSASLKNRSTASKEMMT